jgi:hypothetical protein
MQYRFELASKRMEEINKRVNKILAAHKAGARDGQSHIFIK